MENTTIVENLSSKTNIDEIAYNKLAKSIATSLNDIKYSSYLDFDFLLNTVLYISCDSLQDKNFI